MAEEDSEETFDDDAPTGDDVDGEIEEDLDGDDLDEDDLDEDDLDDDLGLDDDDDDLDDAVVVDDDDDDDDEEGAAPARKPGDDEDEEDDDEVEADLDAILKDRLDAGDDEEEDDDEEEGAAKPKKPVPANPDAVPAKTEDERTCESCWLIKPLIQFPDDGPHCIDCA